MEILSTLFMLFKLICAAPFALIALVLVLSPFLRWGVPYLLRCCKCCGQETQGSLERTRGDGEFHKMRHEYRWTQGTMPSVRGGYNLHTQIWTANHEGKDPTTPRGIVVLFHGLYSHVGEVFFTSDYNIEGSMLERYLGMGFVVCAVDHQSMGQSEGWQGLRGHLWSIDDVVDDAVKFIGQMRQQFPGLKTFVHGHSFGGQVALLASLRCSLDGMVLTTPACAMTEQAKEENASTIKYLWWLPMFLPWLPVGTTPQNDAYPELQKR